MSEQSKLKVGILVDNLLLPIREGIEKAAEMGADGFQVFVTGGEMLAANMGPTERSEFIKFYRDLGLTLSALCADFGRNLGNPDHVADVIPKLRDSVDQAIDLDTRVITTHIGGLPEDRSAPAWEIMPRVLNEIGQYASKRGVVFATETGVEPGDRLRKMLDNLDTDGIRVNFDPANLVMNGFDHLQAARDLAPYVVHTHAKDGRKGVGELPLGEGDVNYPEYVAVWRSLGYDGFFAIERESGDDRVGDVKRAVKFLKSL